MSVSLTNPNAEFALLGTALRAKPEQLVQMAITVRDEAFSVAEHFVVWNVIVDLINNGLPVAPSLLEDGLRKYGTPEAGLKLVEELARAVPTAELWHPLWERVHSYHIRRKGKEACESAIKQFQDLSVPPMTALESAEAGLFSLHAANMTQGMRHISASLNEALASIQESIENRGHVTGGLATGFTDMDRANIKGMRPGQVYLFAAPPGGGKTVWLMKLLWNIAMGKGDYHEYNHEAENVGLFSMEMSDVALAERVLIRLAEIEMNKLDRGTISRDEQERIARAVAEIKRSKFHIEYCPGATIQELRVKARYAVMKFKLKKLGFDYAQITNSSSKEARGNRTQQMMDVSLGYVQLAKECKVPITVLAQPKQETWGYRAGLNALAETSQLAKDAEFVGMLGFWDKLKLSDEEATDMKMQGAEFGRDKDDPRVMAYLDIVKNRNGPNTEGKPPIKLDWARDFYDFVSTTDRLLSGDTSKHQKR